MPVGPKIPPPPETINELATEWLGTKYVVRTMTAREKELNQKISVVVETEGFTDESGHIWLQLPEAVNGLDSKGKTVKYNAIQRQRRVSVLMDEDEALAICEAHGITEECSTAWLQVTDPDRAIEVLGLAGLLEGDNGVDIITSISEDAIRAARFKEQITQAEYEAIFTEKIVYATLPAKL